MAFLRLYEQSHNWINTDHLVFFDIGRDGPKSTLVRLTSGAEFTIPVPPEEFDQMVEAALMKERDV